MAEKFELAPLPYEYNALEPHISEETLKYHHDKHHATYVKKLNGLIENTPFQNKTLEEIMLSSEGKIFNNAAQVWNHDFYWRCLAPEKQTGKPTGKLNETLNKRFDSLDDFKSEFEKFATNLFGSGWTWLVLDRNNELEIVNTYNAENPMTQQKIPLLTCDVWEHAYYIDYRNSRPKYLEGFWNIVNWKFISDRYEKVLASQDEFLPQHRATG
ncbi:MAG: superoxide dismutase [Gammaproteobacteria bacterium]|jgi:Fe-Mn family superoxide dismutase